MTAAIPGQPAVRRRMTALVRELSEIRIEALPEREPIEVITHGVSRASHGSTFLRVRRDILGVLRGWKAPPALGRPPQVVTEPFTIMLWGITSDSVANWLRSSDQPAEGVLSGFAASPGRVEGPARVILGADQIGEVQPGEILVAPLTAPSWAPIFNKILATVTDVGGMMSHAAIVCREYGLPAVTGTAFGTTQIRTGQRIRVDGTNGTVTLIG
jgi:pyruvate, water dikinase